MSDKKRSQDKSLETNKASVRGESPCDVRIGDMPVQDVPVQDVPVQDRHQNAVNILIESANQIAVDENPGLAASALMQAAARYASFYVATSSESRKDFKEDKDSLIQDISREFKRLFSEDLEDYIENYKIYLPEKSEQE